MAEVDVGKLLEDVERKRNVKKVINSTVPRPAQTTQPGEIVIKFNKMTMERLGYWLVILVLAGLVFYNPFADGTSITGNTVIEPPTTTTPPATPPLVPEPTQTTTPPPQTTPTPTTSTSAPTPTPTATGGVDLEILGLTSEVKSYGAKVSGVTIRLKNQGAPFTPVIVVNAWTNSFTTYKETPRKVFKQLQKRDYYEFDQPLATGASVSSFTIQFDFIPVQSGEDINVKVSLYKDSFDVNNPTQNLIKAVTQKKGY